MGLFMRGSRNFLRHWLKRQDGNVTVEFVIVVPFLLSLFFASVDVGLTMLRQVMMDRSMDLAMRKVRLGSPDIGSVDDLKSKICNNTLAVRDCRNNITIEMTPIDTATFTGLDSPTRCINREEDLTPMDSFTPGAGGTSQELMLLRACIAADPFIRITGYLSSMPINQDGQYVLVSRGIFVNEPR